VVISTDMNIQISMVIRFPRCWASAEASSGVESPARPNYAIGLHLDISAFQLAEMEKVVANNCGGRYVAVAFQYTSIFHISCFVFRICP